MSCRITHTFITHGHFSFLAPVFLVALSDSLTLSLALPFTLPFALSFTFSLTLSFFFLQFENPASLVLYK